MQILPAHKRGLAAPGAFEIKLPLSRAVTMTEIVQDMVRVSGGLLALMQIEG